MQVISDTSAKRRLANVNLEPLVGKRDLVPSKQWFKFSIRASLYRGAEERFILVTRSDVIILVNQLLKVIGDE